MADTGCGHCEDHGRLAEDVAVTRAIVERIERVVTNGLSGRMRKIEVRVAVVGATLSAVVGTGVFLLVFSWNALWRWILGT